MYSRYLIYVFSRIRVFPNMTRILGSFLKERNSKRCHGQACAGPACAQKQGREGLQFEPKSTWGCCAVGAADDRCCRARYLVDVEGVWYTSWAGSLLSSYVEAQVLRRVQWWSPVPAGREVPEQQWWCLGAFGKRDFGPAWSQGNGSSSGLSASMQIQC